MLCAWLALLVADPANAQAGMVGQRLAVCVAPAAGIADLDQALGGGVAYDCDKNQRKHGSGDYWAVTAPLSFHSEVADPLVLRAASVWQGTVTFHVVYADGHVVRRVVDGRFMSRHIQLGAIVQFPIPARDAAVTRLAWKIDDAANIRGILLATRIAKASQANRSNIVMAALYGSFAGLALALLVYNLALWQALRHRFQLPYCAMVAALLAYAVSSSGALAWIWPDIANNDRIRVNYLMLALSAATGLAFARRFFEAAVFDRKLDLAVRGASALLAMVGIGFFLFGPFATKALDTAYSWSMLLLFAILPPILFRAWRFRSNYIWLFAIAWSAPVVMAGLRSAHNLGLIGWHFWLDNSTLLAMAFEALISSVAIAYRIRLLSRERDFAVAQEAVQRRLADTDPLTGLLNRRAFLGQAIGRDGPQSLLLIDIDHFKSVNETIGHDGGDEVLRVFARTLRQVSPETALVARLGGEEFALLTPVALSPDPDMVLARLRAARMPFDIEVTASLGMGIGPLLRETDWKALYRATDRALFAAKAAGRDRFRRGDVELPSAA